MAACVRIIDRDRPSPRLPRPPRPSRPPRLRSLRWLAALLLFVVTSARAQANDFRTHYELAVALYQAQKFEEAIPEFQAAYKIDPRAGLLFNIAQSYRKAGHPREAIQYYDRYLTSDPRIDTDTRRKVDGYLAEARNTLAALELEMKQRLAEEKAARESEPPPPALAAPPSFDPNQPPPQPNPYAAQPPLAPAPGLVAVEPRAETPVYKKAWFWAVIGSVVVVGVTAGVAAGVVVSRNRQLAPDGVPKAVLAF
jgi:tetratricopeptide (TPR) repeat protein